MLASLAVVLQPLEPIQSIPEGIGYAVRGWFYEVLGQTAPEVAQKLHQTQAVKPFTLSPLLGPGRRRKGMLHLKPRPYTLRITALTEEVYRAISKRKEACCNLWRGAFIYELKGNGQFYRVNLP